MLLFHIEKLPALGRIDNYDKVNEVLLNLSYSYLAGLVFYLINDGIPSLIRRVRANKHIGKYVCEIQSQLNYITTLCDYIKSKSVNAENVLYIEVSSKKKWTTKKDKKSIHIDSEINDAIIRIDCNLETIETMLVSCYLSSETSLLLSEIRTCFNCIDNNKGKSDVKIDRLKSLSKKVDSHFWFPEKHAFRVLTPAEASTIENSHKL